MSGTGPPRRSGSKGDASPECTGDDDWRLRGQEPYLEGLAFVRREYTPPRSGWDHDHCEFCWAEFGTSSVEEVLREGFCTPDQYRWVCPTCFEDFRDRFGWTVEDRGDEAVP